MFNDFSLAFPFVYAVLDCPKFSLGNMKNSKSHWKRKIREKEALNVTAENQFPIS